MNPSRLAVQLVTSADGASDRAGHTVRLNEQERSGGRSKGGSVPSAAGRGSYFGRRER